MDPEEFQREEAEETSEDEKSRKLHLLRLKLTGLRKQLAAAEQRGENKGLLRDRRQEIENLEGQINALELTFDSDRESKQSTAQITPAEELRDLKAQRTALIYERKSAYDSGAEATVLAYLDEQIESLTEQIKPLEKLVRNDE